MQRTRERATPFDVALSSVARLAGFEPTTPWFVAKYSIQLSYSREACNYSSTRAAAFLDHSHHLGSVGGIGAGMDGRFLRSTSSALSAARPPCGVGGRAGSPPRRGGESVFPVMAARLPGK
jgi:hypothetical protein